MNPGNKILKTIVALIILLAWVVSWLVPIAAVTCIVVWIVRHL